MANNIIDSMMKQAIAEANNFAEHNGIESKYLGAVSSFGTSVISSGIKPTLLFYSAKGGKFAQFENSLINIINSYLYPNSIDDVYAYDNKDHILDAVTALKLAMRTYKKIDNKGGNNG